MTMHTKCLPPRPPVPPVVGKSVETIHFVVLCTVSRGLCLTGGTGGVGARRIADVRTYGPINAGTCPLQAKLTSDWS